MKILQNIDYKIRPIEKPKMAIVPLKIANGDSALPIVKMNEIVKCGQVVAKSAGFNSVDVFSPVYGKIIGFDTYPLSDHSKAYCVYIENMENSQNCGESNKCTNNYSGKTEKCANHTTSESKVADGTKKKANDTMFAFKELKSKSKTLFLKRLADCGVIDHNGDSMSDKLSKQHKILCIPCFDSTPYACENTAVLASDDFDDIYKITKEIADIFAMPVVFACQKGDTITGIENTYDVKTQLKNGEFYKLFINKINPNKIFAKHFASRFTAQELAVNQDDNTVNTPTPSARVKVDTLQSEKSTLLNDMLNSTKTKIDLKCESVTVLHDNKNSESATNNNNASTDEGATNIDKFEKMRQRALATSPYKNLENMLVLTPIDLLQIHRAIKFGSPQTTTIATFGGSAITSNGVYEICSGCTLEHIQNSLGGTHSEQDIEDEKNDVRDAIEDFFDARAKYKDEKDKSKKIELKKAKQQKKRIAKLLALNFVKTSKKKLKTCLGQIAFDDIENGETFGDFRAVFELRNHGIYYLTCKQC